VSVERPGEWTTFDMAKDIKMNNTEAELKAIAKAAGASLRRQGHAVPHSVMLHAIAAAMNKRDWHKLKSSLDGAEPVQAPAHPTAYSDTTTLFLLLAAATGDKVFPVPADDTEALARAKAAAGNSLSGTVLYDGVAQEAVLDLETWKLDAGSMVPKSIVDTAAFHVTLRGGLGLVLTVTYTPGANWYLSAAGMTGLRNQLVSAVGADNLFKATTPRDKMVALMGPEVPAKFWTDDHQIEVEFDAQAYLAQAADEQLRAIHDVGFSGDYCTDAIAEFMAHKGLNEDIAEGFTYLEALNKARRLRGDTMGFECSVDGEAFLRWMDQHKGPLLANMLCDFHEVRIVEAQEEEIAGMWDWLDNQGNACDHSAETREEAEMDAYLSLNLLQQTLDML
jgi:protein-disulfide isomerase